jgi:hypothetical protein
MANHLSEERGLRVESGASAGSRYDPLQGLPLADPTAGPYLRAPSFADVIMADSSADGLRGPAPSDGFLEKWQLRLLPFMQAVIVLVGLYFVLVGERRFTEFEGVLAPASSPTDSLAARIARLSGQATKPGDIEFATRAALEVEALRLRYVEANTLILSRAPAS